MGNWKKQKYKRKTVRPKRISHRQIAKNSNQSNKYMRLDSKNLYTSLINKIHNMDISKIEISSGKEIHSSVRCSIHEAHYYIAIKTPTDKMVEFIYNLVKFWNKEKKARKNLRDYELLLYLSFNEKSSPINEFRKIPLSKSKKLRVFYTLSLEECYKLSNNYYAGLGDLIPIIFPWPQEDPGDDGSVETCWSDNESDGNGGGGGIPKYRFTEGFGYWRPGPGLIAAKMPPRDVGGFGGTGLEILRSTHINPKEIIESKKHDKKPKGEYGSIVVTVQESNPKDDKLGYLKGTAYLGEDSKQVKIYVDKPIEAKPQRLYPGLAGRMKTAKLKYIENDGTISRKVGRHSDNNEGHPITCKVTVNLKDDSLEKNKKKKGGQRTTQRRRASSVAASRKVGKIRTTSHTRRKK